MKKFTSYSSVAALRLYGYFVFIYALSTHLVIPNQQIAMSIILPWRPGVTPLMLAPMQGITNKALRSLFIEWARPDVVFTEFVRIRPGSKKVISEVDRREVSSHVDSVPLVVQLIGRDLPALVAAAMEIQNLGARHLNINLGCPFGRMNANSAGGAMLKSPDTLPQTLETLRRTIHGTFSVKMRAGYDDHRQVLSLLSLFENTGIDFLVLHPRTVVQKYDGLADHEVTAEVVGQTSIPIIANGDIRSAADGNTCLAVTKAAGLMMGRGAISDPLLFKRLRGEAPAVPDRGERAKELRYYVTELLQRYRGIFRGDTQVLCKLKAVLSQINDERFKGCIRDLKRARNMKKFVALIDTIK